MKKKIHLISLGCCKNLVDSEKILASFYAHDWLMTDAVEQADCIVVNTCGFIDSAKQEAIDTILEAAGQKKDGEVLVATGCLAQRYPEAIFTDMPEVDLVIGIDLCDTIVDEVEQFTERKLHREEPASVYTTGKRLYTSAPHYAYVRIADGCNNFCSYCAIPYIRGRYRSRKFDEIMEEVRSLAADGVREIILVAQDTTRYGMDNGQPNLAALLRAVAHVEGVEWVRFLYAYPEMMTDEIIAAIAEEPHICNYVDIPIQHCNDRILKKMNRGVTKQQLVTLIEKLRSQKEPICVRTTVMTGFPTETEEEHQELLDFIRTSRFDRLGAFAFCPEEGTRAAAMDGQIDEDVKERRLDEIMRLQQEVSKSVNEARVGKTFDCAVDSFDDEERVMICRSEYEVPEVDGTVLVPVGEDDVEPFCGMVLPVHITNAMIYDLMGEIE